MTTTSTGRKVLVTGGGAGIGAGVARAFAAGRRTLDGGWIAR
ncbi:hypothetical protein [Sphaerisporangium sp. NPDC051011]